MDFDFDPETAAQVRVGLASFTGGLIYHAVRPAGSFAKVVTRTIASVLAGFVFTEPAMLYFGISTAYTGAVGALIGLLGPTLASNALRAVEKLDLAALFKGGIK